MKPEDILLIEEEKAIAVAMEMERTKDNPDSMMDYSDIIAKAQHEKSYAAGRRELMEQLDEKCPHYEDPTGDWIPRRKCTRCMAALRREYRGSDD